MKFDFKKILSPRKEGCFGWNASFIPFSTVDSWPWLNGSCASTWARSNRAVLTILYVRYVTLADHQEGWHKMNNSTDEEAILCRFCLSCSSSRIRRILKRCGHHFEWQLKHNWRFLFGLPTGIDAHMWVVRFLWRQLAAWQIWALRHLRLRDVNSIWLPRDRRRWWIRWYSTTYRQVSDPRLIPPVAPEVAYCAGNPLTNPGQIQPYANDTLLAKISYYMCSYCVILFVTNIRLPYF